MIPEEAPVVPTRAEPELEAGEIPVSTTDKSAISRDFSQEIIECLCGLGGSNL